MRSRQSRNFFVLTGGPGSGKTTLIDDLQTLGFATAPEAGRAIIRAQSAIGGPALPGNDPALFAEMMLSWELRSHDAYFNEPGAVFFDRGVPDVVAYLKLMGLPVPPHVQRAAETFRYNETAFICPPWPAIYAQDSERKQTLEEAERTYDAMQETYRELGYRLVEVAPAPVEQRRKSLLATIAAFH